VAIPERAQIIVKVLSEYGDDGTLAIAIAAIREAEDRIARKYGIPIVSKATGKQFEDELRSQVKGMLVTLSKTPVFTVWMRHGSISEIINALTSSSNIIVTPSETSSLEEVRQEAKTVIKEWSIQGFMSGFSTVEFVGMGILGIMTGKLLLDWYQPRRR
jgi:hypothetical protein